MKLWFDTTPSLSFLNYIRVATACCLAWGLIVLVVSRAIGPSHNLWFLACVVGAVVVLVFASRATLRAFGVRFVSMAEGTARRERDRYHVSALSLGAYVAVFGAGLVLGGSPVVQQFGFDWPDPWSNWFTYRLIIGALIWQILVHRAGQRAALRASGPRVEPDLG